jgi:hypothetical protein
VYETCGCTQEKLVTLQAYVCGSELMRENSLCMSYRTEIGGFARLKAVVAITLKACLLGWDAVSTGK